MSRIIAWHMLTNKVRKLEAEDFRQNYIEVLENGILLPASHREENLVYLRNPTVYGIDALAGDDDNVFLSLLPYETKNYFLAQSDSCYFGPDSVDWRGMPPYLNSENRWVYGNCEIRGYGLRPRQGAYGFGFDAEQLIEEGSFFSNEDLIDLYRDIVKEDIITIKHIIINIRQCRDRHSMVGVKADQFPTDLTTLEKLLAALNKLKGEKEVIFKSSDPLIYNYMQDLKFKLYEIQKINRLSGQAALAELNHIVSYCYDSFNNKVSKFGDLWKGCPLYEKAEIIHPGPLTLDKALYFIEDGIVYSRDGKRVSEHTPSFSDPYLSISPKNISTFF